MAQIHWTKAVNGNFATQADWSPANVPGAADDAIIDAVGTYTVTVAANAAVNTFDTLTGATLAVAAGKTFSAGSGVNAGKITVGDGALFGIGSLDNIGSLSLNGSKNTASLVIDGAVNIFGGNGTVTLSNNTHNQIISDGTNRIFDNLDDTIQGAGTIGDGAHLTVINDHSATINANGSVALNIKTGNVVTNNGVMEATGTGGLHIVDVVNQAGGGTLAAFGAKAHVDLDHAFVSGGTLQTTGGGVIKTVTGSDATIFSALGNLASLHGTLDVVDQSTLFVDGLISSTGTIALQGSKGVTSMIVTGTTSFSGGQITMSDNANNVIKTNGNAFKVLVDGNISGAGTIGDSQMTFDNRGIVDATGKNTLFIDAGTVDNNNILEATGSSTLSLLTNVTNGSGAGIEALGKGHVVLNNNVVIDNTGGTVGALSSGAHLDIGTVAAGGTAGISGGTVAIGAGAALTTIVGPNQATPTSLLLVDGTMKNAGTVTISDNSIVTLGGITTTETVINSGTIALMGATKATELTVGGTDGAIVTGGGKITMTDSSFNFIESGGADTTFENVDNVISGSGQFGDSHFIFHNDLNGVINASGKTHALVIDANANSTNDGLIEMTGAGGLQIDSDIDQGATGMVVDASKTGTMTISSFVHGGIIKAAVAGATITFDDGVAFGGGGVFTVAGSTITTVTKTANSAADLNNAGTVNITNDSSLNLSSHVFNFGTVNVNSTGQQTVLDVSGSFAGHGKIVMSDNSNNLIDANQGVTISNAADLLTFGGTVTAGDVLSINFTDGLTFNVTEAVTATNTDTLATLAQKFANEINLDLTLAAHSIQAAAASNFVGVIQPGDVGDNTFVTPIIPGGATETINGSSAKLAGGGNDGEFFENIDNTITGAGTIGNTNDLILHNDLAGTINANGTHQLVINTGNYDVINNGLIEATGTGGLRIAGAILNNGHIVANNSTVEIDGSITGFGGAQIAGTNGVLHLEAVANFQDITFAAGSKGELILNHPENYVGRILGFGANTTQSIDLADITFTNQSATWTPASNGVEGTLHVTDGTHTADLTLVGHYLQGNFTLHDDGSGHVLVTDPPVHGHADLLMH